jgi:hypothetical protein
MPGFEIGADVIDAMTVDALDGIDLLRGPELDEIADRHHAARRGHAHVVERVNAARGRGIAHADVDLLRRIVGTVLADENAVGDELHGRADRLCIGAEAVGDVAVDVEVPFDAGQRTRVFKIAQLLQTVHMASDHIGRLHGKLRSRRMRRRSSRPCRSAVHSGTRTSTCTPRRLAVFARISSRITLPRRRSCSPSARSGSRQCCRRARRPGC